MASGRFRGEVNQGSRGGFRSDWRDVNRDEESGKDFQQLRPGYHSYRGLSNQYDRGRRGYRHPGQANKRCVTDPPAHSFMAQIFKELAEIYSATSSIPSAIDMPLPKIILPYADEDTRVSFVNHYGNVFVHVLRFEPKVMTYNRAQNEGDTPAKIQSAIQNIVEELHQVTDDKYCYMELDFIKIVFTDPKPPLSFPKSNLKPVEVTKMIEERSPELLQYMHRMCLDENEDVLLDKLRGYGAELVEHHEAEDEYRVEVYSRGFKFDNHIYGGTISLTSDLTFSNWIPCRTTTATHLLPNPGCENNFHLQTEGGDLRLKGFASTKTEVDDMQEMAGKVNKTLPSYLTSPNLGGLLQKDGDSGFILKPNAGIVGLSVMNNRMKYTLSLNGIEFRLIVVDLKYLRYDRETQSLVVDRVADRWPTFKFPVPSSNEVDISNFVETFSDLITKLMNDLSNGEILPKIWSTNVITHGVPTPSIMIQNLRRRIIEKNNLRLMLDIPPDAPRESVMKQYQNLLGAFEERRIILSDATISKLKAVARSENYDLGEDDDY